MNIKSALVAICAFLALATGVAFAHQLESNIAIDNRSDGYVSVTAFARSPHTLPGMKGQEVGYWCVDPHTKRNFGVEKPVNKVRAEIGTRGCQRSMVFSQTLGYPNGDYVGPHWETYYVYGTYGSYTFTNLR